ncbi:hypothetical protein Tco_0766949 [Tanacetum coccineum]
MSHATPTPPNSPFARAKQNGKEVSRADKDYNQKALDEYRVQDRAKKKATASSIPSASAAAHSDEALASALNATRILVLTSHIVACGTVGPDAEEYWDQSLVVVDGISNRDT